MKTYTAQEFEIEFYKSMHDWVANGKVGPDPRGEWEHQGCIDDKWRSFGNCVPNPTFDDPRENYRWKPAKKRTVVIDGVELVAPEVDMPNVGTVYFYPGMARSIDGILWAGDSIDQAFFRDGRVFLTIEDAKAMADAQRKQRMGGVL